MEKELATNVWLMSGFIISYTPGMLVLKEGKITLLTDKGDQFSVPATDITNVKWPGMQMGFGVQMVVNGKKYKLTFGHPSGTKTFTEAGDPAMTLLNIPDLMSRVGHMKDDKANAKQWREVLGG